jgi:hypothetical protein
VTPVPPPAPGTTTPSQLPPGCVITSAGLQCPQLPPGCVITSGGLQCPPTGGVQEETGGSTPTPTPTPTATPGGGVQQESGRSPAPVPVARPLPIRRLAFTGHSDVAVALLGAALLAGGLALRRRSSSS